MGYTELAAFIVIESNDICCHCFSYKVGADRPKTFFDMIQMTVVDTS